MFKEMSRKEKLELSNIDFLIQTAKEMINQYEQEIKINNEFREDEIKDLEKLKNSEQEFNDNKDVLNFITNRRNRWEKSLKEYDEKIISDNKNLGMIIDWLLKLENAKESLENNR